MSHPRQNCTCKCALYTVTSVELGCMKSCRITGSLLWFNRMPLFQMPEELSSWSTNMPFCCKKCSFCFNSVLFCPEYHPKPLVFTQPSHPFWGYVLIMYMHKTSPTPPQNTPLLGLNSKVGKMNYNWATWTPTGQYVWKADKKFLEVDKKKNSWLRASREGSWLVSWFSLCNLRRSENWSAVQWQESRCIGGSLQVRGHASPSQNGFQVNSLSQWTYWRQSLTQWAGQLKRLSRWMGTDGVGEWVAAFKSVNGSMAA